MMRILLFMVMAVFVLAMSGVVTAKDRGQDQAQIEKAEASEVVVQTGEEKVMGVGQEVALQEFEGAVAKSNGADEGRLLLMRTAMLMGPRGQQEAAFIHGEETEVALFMGPPAGSQAVV